MRKKKRNLKIVRLIIIVILIGLIVVAGNAIIKKTADNKGIGNTNIDNDITAKKDAIKEKLSQTESYYWQNPSEEYEEAIIMGMQGASISFNEDGGFAIDGGNGNWQEGSYEIIENNIICRIERSNSAWHKEEEILESTTEIKFLYNEQKNSLEVTNITKTNLTMHVIDMVTGELTEETKEYSLEQFSVGNIYSSENKYEEVY